MRKPFNARRCLLRNAVQSTFGAAGGCQWVERLELRCLLSNVAQPDPTFADNGVALTGFAGENPYGTAITVTSEGKPIIASAQEASGSEFATGLNLARFNTDGSLDSSFGTGGKSSIAISRFLIGDAAVQSDGKLLVAGTVADPNYPTSSTAVMRFIVFRLNSNGSLDDSFGTNGSVVTAFTSIDPTFSAEAKHIAISSNGEIAVGGSTMENIEDGDHVGTAIAVYNTSGQLLTSFSNDGLVTNIVTAPDSDEIYGMAFQPDGKLLVSSESMVASTSTDSEVLMRYNADGTPDSSFGTNGEVQSTTASAKLLLATQIVVAPDNKILLGAGNTLDVERLNANGSRDTTFGGGDGIAQPATGVSGNSYGILRLSDGMIRVAGTTWVQYNADGTPDSTFGTQITQFPAKALITPGQPGVFDSNGKLIVAARYLSADDSSTQFAVVRIGRDDVALGNDGTLWVDGTTGDDTVTISPLNSSARLVRNGVTTDFTKAVTSVQLNLGAGNDVGTVTLDVPVSAQGGAGDDSITTAGGNDTILDSSGNDTIITGGGDDVVKDTKGRDSIVTGAGNDRVVLCVVTTNIDPEIPPVVTSVIAATVSTGDGNDTVVAGGDITATLGDGNDTFGPPANLGTRADDSFNVDGGNGNDNITGSPNADSIVGGAGNDTLYGMAGNDTVYGNDGNDWIDGGSGNDSVYGNANSDTIYGGYGDDRVAGNGGNDHLTGGALGGDDGVDGNDRVYGGDGNDAISGDYYHKIRPGEVNHSGATIRSSSQPGNDWLDGGAGNDTLLGVGGNDTLIGGPGNDNLNGGDGNDVLYARDGQIDTLDGGAGNDKAQVDNGPSITDLVTNVESFF